EVRLAVDRRGVAKLAHAVPFGDHDGAVFDDGEGDAGDLEFFQDACDGRVDVGGGGRTGAGVRSVRGCGRLGLWGDNEQAGDEDDQGEEVATRRQSQLFGKHG